MGIKRCSAIVFLSIVFGISGCGFFRHTADVVVETPGIPEGIKQVGGRVGFDLVVGTETVAENVAPDRRVAVSVPTGEPIALLGYLRMPDLAVRLPPAGAVFRESSARGSFPLAFDMGVAATIIARLARAGVPTSAVNIERLIREVGKRAGERQWDIDIEAVVDAFVDGEMHARKLEPTDGAGVVVEEVSGAWTRVDALRPEVLTADSEQGLTLAALSPGTHVYAGNDTAQWLIVSVTSDGETGWMLSPRSER